MSTNEMTIKVQQLRCKGIPQGARGNGREVHPPDHHPPPDHRIRKALSQQPTKALRKSLKRPTKGGHGYHIMISRRIQGESHATVN